MDIGGLQKFSLIDYPNKIAAVIFTIGCNFRCSFCHNPELVIPTNYTEIIPESEVLDFLEKRKGQLQGIVVTGGEPTIQKDIVHFLRKLKAMNYSVKLDTNGYNPAVLNQLIAGKLVDFIAMDLKAPLEKYSDVTGIGVNTDLIEESITIIYQSQLPHEFRTTFVESQLTDNDITQIKKLINNTENYRLQKFVHNKKILEEVVVL